MREERCLRMSLRGVSPILGEPGEPGPELRRDTLALNSFSSVGSSIASQNRAITVEREEPRVAFLEAESDVWRDRRSSQSVVKVLISWGGKSRETRVRSEA